MGWVRDEFIAEPGDWQNVFIAGGAVLSSVISHPQGFGASDIDIFLVGMEPEVNFSSQTSEPQGDEIQEKLRHILEVICKNTGASGKVRYRTLFYLLIIY
jgi:hypothetical protein